MQRRIKISIAVVTLAMLGTAGIVAIPSRTGENIGQNESAIAAFLKHLGSAQAVVQNSGAIDADQDGNGEYAFLGAMMNPKVWPGPDEPTQLSDLNLSRLTYVEKGIYRLNGYYLRVYLPGRNGKPTFEGAAKDSPAGKADATLSARVYWAVAWPISYRVTGNRCFFTNQTGDVLISNNSHTRYSGMERMPPANVAVPLTQPPTPPWAGTFGSHGAGGELWVRM